MKNLVTKTSLRETFEKLIEDNDILIMQDDYDNILKAIEKQTPRPVIKSDYDRRSDSYPLLCPCCNSNAGSMDNEDGDGVYKYNLYFDYCPKCGQKLERDDVSNDEYYLNVGDDVMNMITREEYKIIRIDRKDGIVVCENEHEKRVFGKELTYRISCLSKIKK